ncbi:indole-3-glycerol phosphate synthase TrpC [Paenibacillus sp. 481]|uniref:indole-3-glycerol phosphate synthase TrpC n=1 Tax=Paenibacillus sp. 481 TaxID=2835869 RepID=UPI001E3ABD9D|nr:indole-3-glycerol phosphate synthase TrpC [Paenibacillus sp. 481]UHA72969.1 indole-3-glycerol phosphate synthase TrpC [Paenibacillus sp. 481]
MFLERIVATKREEVAELRQQLSRAEAERRIAALTTNCQSLSAALTSGRKRSVGLIAEVKKASPSKGLIRADFDPPAIVKDYVAAGADALSVLTDRTYFQGGNEILQQVRALTTLPLLRKEFIIDELQILEARLLGADAVLLIAAILNDDELKRMNQLALDLGMEALIEVHDEAELRRVAELEQVKLLGVNNRNLHTFVTDISQTSKLKPLIPEGCVYISESGIHLPEHLTMLAEIGADAVLVGEHFMRQADVRGGVEHLMSGLDARQFATQELQPGELGIGSQSR